MNYKNIQGWFSFKNIYDNMINKYDNGVFVEIGAWFGKSTAYMAQQIKENNKAIEFHVIDTWEGTEGLPVGDMAKKLGGDVYHIFENNMINCNVIDYMNIIKESSLTAHNKFKNESIDFLLIDGDHRYEGVKADINNWYPKIKIGGIIAGDDYDKVGVRKAIDEYVLTNNLTLYKIDGDNWLIKK